MHALPPHFKKYFQIFFVLPHSLQWSHTFDMPNAHANFLNSQLDSCPLLWFKLEHQLWYLSTVTYSNRQPFFLAACRHRHHRHSATVSLLPSLSCITPILYFPSIFKSQRSFWIMQALLPKKTPTMSKQIIKSFCSFEFAICIFNF